MCTPRVQKPNLMARVNCAAARVLAPTESLAAVSREPFAKRRNQSAVCYLIIDREGEWTLMGQKIALLSTWINQHVANEQWARVSTTGLWGNCDVTNGRVGGWHKGRWRIRSVDMNRATAEFEALRLASKRAVVVAGAPACYAVR